MKKELKNVQLYSIWFHSCLCISVIPFILKMDKLLVSVSVYSNGTSFVCTADVIVNVDHWFFSGQFMKINEHVVPMSEKGLSMMSQLMISYFLHFSFLIIQII